MNPVIIGFVVASLGVGLGYSAPTGAPARSAPAPQDQVRKALQAADRPWAVGPFRFRIARVAFDSTAMGFIPEGMAPGDRLIFVECELLSGDREDFKGLVLILRSGSGRRSKAAVLLSEGMMKALTALTIKASSYAYRPERSHIAWAFVVPEFERDFFLIFPTGTVIDLSPLIKEDRAETVRAGDHRMAHLSAAACMGT
jgi:hypothetical protein